MDPISPEETRRIAREHIALNSPVPSQVVAVLLAENAKLRAVIKGAGVDAAGHKENYEHARRYGVKPVVPACIYCGGTCLPDDCAVIFTPINDCEHKNKEDGCCSHPKNMTPECHVAACPRLHRRLKT